MQTCKYQAISVGFPTNRVLTTSHRNEPLNAQKHTDAYEPYLGVSGVFRRWYLGTCGVKVERNKVDPSDADMPYDVGIWRVCFPFRQYARCQEPGHCSPKVKKPDTKSLKHRHHP